MRKKFWKLKNKWKSFYPQLKHKHRLIVLDSDTFTEKFTFKLTGINLFTAIGLSVIILIILTTVLIAFTPLREYIPGYSNEKMEAQTYKNAEKIGVNAPLVAGIMPVTNAAQIRRITELCHCAVPKKLENLLDKFGHDDESMYKAGVVYAAEQIIELVSNDVKGIHLYTMNRSQAVTEILNMVNFVRK